MLVLNHQHMAKQTICCHRHLEPQSSHLSHAAQLPLTAVVPSTVSPDLLATEIKSNHPHAHENPVKPFVSLSRPLTLPRTYGRQTGSSRRRNVYIFPNADLIWQPWHSLEHRCETRLTVRYLIFHDLANISNIVNMEMAPWLPREPAYELAYRLAQWQYPANIGPPFTTPTSRPT